MKKFLFRWPAHLLLVFCGLFGAVFCLVTGFELTVDEELLFWGTVAVTVCFTLLFSIRSGVWKTLLLLLMSGGLGYGVVRLWEQLKLGAEGVLYQVQGLYLSAFGFADSEGLEVTLEELREGETLFLLLAAILLGCYLAWGVVSLRTFWPGALVTAVFLAPSLMLMLLPHWAPLTALLLFYCVGLLLRIAGKDDAQGGAKLIYLALPLSLVLLLVLRLAMPEGEYSRSQWADEQRRLLMNYGLRVGEVVASGDVSALPQVVAGNPSTTVDLSKAGPLNFTGRTVLRVTSPLDGRIYLRGWSTGRYEDNCWLPLEDELYGEYLGSALTGSAADWSDLAGWQPQVFSAVSSRTANPYQGSSRVKVEELAGDYFLYVPYYLESGPDELTGATYFRDEYLERTAGYQDFSFEILWEIDPAARVPDDAVRTELAYRKLVHDGYTALPEDYDVQALLDDFNSWRWNIPGISVMVGSYTAEAGTGEEEGPPGATWWSDGSFTYTFQDDLGTWRREMVRLVAEYLSKRCVYDPDTPLTPEGEDFVTYFLNESRRGYCTHFASAATVLLRAMHIPARYTVGYVTDVETGRPVDVADYASHAWVEVYLDGIGWVPFEVTAGFDGALPWDQQAEPTPTPEPEATPAMTPPPLHTPGPRETPAPATPTPAPTAAVEEPVEEEPGPDLWWLWLLPAAAALAGLEAARWNWMLWRRKRRLADPPSNRAVINGYLDLERILSWTGAEPPEALEALALKAKFSQHTLTEEERAAFLAGVSAEAKNTRKALPWYKKLPFTLVHGGWLRKQ